MEYLRRIVLIVATGNADAHLKNWSLLYRDPKRPCWSPLYDQVATIAYRDLDRKLALMLGHAKHFYEVDLTHIDAVVRRWRSDARSFEDWADVVPADIVEQTLIDLRLAFEPEALGIRPALAEMLRTHWVRVPLLRRFAPL